MFGGWIWMFLHINENFGCDAKSVPRLGDEKTAQVSDLLKNM